MNPGTEHFPRELTSQEKLLLFSVLPDEKPGYRAYREKIDKLAVTGYGRSKNNNFILGNKNTIPDLSFSSSPVFTAGIVTIPGDEIDIMIHEEVDDEIEFDLSLKNSDVIQVDFELIDKWSYSNWNPGDKSPNDQKEVREIIISPDKYILVFAPTHKKIWMHVFENGVNNLIPLTNFYNELMGFKRIKDPGEALNPRSFFQKLDEFSDYELMNAFVLYNKYMKRFKTDFSKYLKNPVIKRKKSITDLFRKDKD